MRPVVQGDRGKELWKIYTGGDAKHAGQLAAQTTVFPLGNDESIAMTKHQGNSDEGSAWRAFQLAAG